MLSNSNPNKYRSTIRISKGQFPIWTRLCGLWLFSILLSLFFMDSIYLYALSLEQHQRPNLQQIGLQTVSWIDQHPAILQISKVKNKWRKPIESFYEREMRFGTIQTNPQSNVMAPTVEPTTADKPKSTETNDVIPPPILPPRKVLMLGGSSMKTAMGSLLQAHFRGINSDTIRKAQIGTGLSRADVVDWVQTSKDILSVHRDIDLLLVQFIGNDCQTIVDANHNILAKYDSAEWNVQYLKRWEALRTLSEEYDIPMAIIGMPMMKSKRFDQKIQTVSTTVQTWAAANAIPFIEIRSLTTTEDGEYQQYITKEDRPLKIRLKDGVHLSYQGSKIVSQHIFEQLQSTFAWSIDNPTKVETQ